MIVWQYAAQSLAWSGLGFLVGAAVTAAGCDITSLLRNSGRQKRDHT